MPKLFKKIMLIIGVFIYILAICPVNMQNDTFFDIVLGKTYLTSGIYTIDNFSVHKNLVYQTQHLFVDLIVYKIYSLYNFYGLYMLEILLTCIIAALFYILNKQFTKSKKIAYLMMFLELYMFIAFISLRAQMFSAIVFLIEMILINKYLYNNFSKKVDNILLITLTIIPPILINFHSGVIFFYYIIIGVYLVNLFRIKFIRIESDNDINYTKLKRLIIPALVSLPLLLLNPYGLNGLTYVFKTLNNTFINANIEEFQPFNIKCTIGMAMSIYFAIHIFGFIFSDKKIKVQEILFFLGTLFMTLLSIRHFIFYIIVTIVLLPHLEFVILTVKNWFYRGLNKNGPKIMTITIDMVLFFILFSTVVNTLAKKETAFIPMTQYPVEAVNFIKKNIGADQVIFNEYSWGSLMMLNDIKVFIDSRADLYTKEYNKDVTIAEDYINTTRCKMNYQDTVSKYNIEYFFIPKDMPLTVMLLKDTNYEVMYKDNISYIFKKK